VDLGIARKWALVCGASKGLGFGCARALAREGVHVTIVARQPDTLMEAAKRLRAEASDVQVVPVTAEITTDEGRRRVFRS
jgi:3-oxoacyl-[acyl-carrier protein] reductase